MQNPSGFVIQRRKIFFTRYHSVSCMTCIVMHALIRHYHAFSLLRRAIRPSLPSIFCLSLKHPIPSAGSSKASSQLHSDCLAPSGSSLLSIPLLLFLFIAFHYLFYIITYLFLVPQGVILSILLIYFNIFIQN